MWETGLVLAAVQFNSCARLVRIIVCGGISYFVFGFVRNGLGAAVRPAT